MVDPPASPSNPIAVAKLSVSAVFGEDMSDSQCLICSLDNTEPDARVFLDDLWAAEVALGYEVPGWFFLRTRRHADALAGLDDAEAATFGDRARDLVRAVEEATGAPATYLMHFGEHHRHFHALVVARGAEVAPEYRGGAVVALLASGRDRATALAVASGVREAFERRKASARS